jgi:EpsI family protein
MAVVQKKYWVVFGLLLAAILYRYALSRGSGLPPERIDLLEVPQQVGNWRGTDQPLEQRILEMLGLDAYIQRKYVDHSGKALWLYVGYYQQQRQGKGIHSPKHCYPGAGWSLVEKGVESVPLNGDGREMILVNRMIFQKDRAKQLILYWFQSSNRIAHSEYTHRIYMVLDAIIFNRTDGALVKVSAPVAGNLAEVLDYQKEFIREIYPSLKRDLAGE